MRNVSANARQRTTDVVISSADAASSWRWGDIGGDVVAVGDAGGDGAAAGAAAAAAGASVPASAAGAAAADVSASPPLDGATGSFFSVSSLSNTQQGLKSSRVSCYVLSLQDVFENLYSPWFDGRRTNNKTET